MINNDPDQLLETLRIFKIQPREIGGSWVKGTIGDYKFEALVFQESAVKSEWEVNGDSKISKLCIYDESGRILFSWDRGSDVESSEEGVQTIVELLAAGLAEHVF